MRVPVVPIAEVQADHCGRPIRDCIDRAIACVGEGRGHDLEGGAA